MKTIVTLVSLLVLTSSLFSQSNLSEKHEQLRQQAIDSTTGQILPGYKWQLRGINEKVQHFNDNGQEATAKTLWNGIKEAQKLNQKSLNRARQTGWIPKGPNNVPSVQPEGRFPTALGRINSITFHPTDSNHFWVGVGLGGIWETKDGGKNWTPKNDGLPILRISDVAIDQKNPERLYASMGDYAYVSLSFNTHGRRHTATGLGVYISDNGGDSWYPSGLSMALDDIENAMIRRTIVHPQSTNELLAAGIGGIWKSYDAGITWDQLDTTFIWDIETDPNHPNTLYATSGYIAGIDIYDGVAEIWKSTDFGESWKVLNNPHLVNDFTQRIEVVVAPSNSDIVYAISSEFSGGLAGFQRSDNGGITWESMTSAPNLLGYSETGSSGGGQGNYDLAIAVDPFDANKVLVGGINIWTTADGGENWMLASSWRENVHADQHMLKFNPISNNLFLCNDGGVVYTEEVEYSNWKGTNWTNITDGMNISTFYRLGITEDTENIIVAGAQDNSTFVSNENGDWISAFSGDGMECEISPLDSDIIYGSSQRGFFYKSTDGGLTYESFHTGMNGAWTTPFQVIDFDRDLTVFGFTDIWIGEYLIGLFEQISEFATLDSAANFSICNAIGLFQDDYQTMYAARSPGDGAARMAATHDRGTTWVAGIGLPKNQYIYSIAVDEEDNFTSWCTTSGLLPAQKVYKTTDGGYTWKNISLNLPNVSVNCIVQDNFSVHSDLYVGTDQGVYFINDTMSSWVPYNLNLENITISELEINYSNNSIVAATHGRGIWIAPLYSGQLSALELITINSSVSPNPNNGVFTITLPKNTRIQYRIVDIFGRNVQTGELTDQFNTIQTTVPTGAYFLVLNNGKKQMTHKVIIER